ncbi:MAG: ferrous iron transport protein A [Acholeplasmatales bacterium]|nr:ferrous iron transport protein A [Acholeplasmatales bacterium]
MEKRLDELVIGESGVIKTVGGEGRIRRRLFDMGVTPNAEVFLRKKAPLGDPIEVTLRGYELTLRKSEAQNVIVVLNDETAKEEGDK